MSGWEPEWIACCEHCGCDPWPSVGHDDTCSQGCNDAPAHPCGHAVAVRHCGGCDPAAGFTFDEHGVLVVDPTVPNNDAYIIMDKEPPSV